MRQQRHIQERLIVGVAIAIIIAIIAGIKQLFA